MKLKYILPAVFLSAVCVSCVTPPEQHYVEIKETVKPAAPKPKPKPIIKQRVVVEEPHNVRPVEKF